MVSVVVCVSEGDGREALREYAAVGVEERCAERDPVKVTTGVKVGVMDSERE